MEARRRRVGSGSSSRRKRGGPRCEGARYRDVRGQAQSDRALSSRREARVSQSEFISSSA